MKRKSLIVGIIIFELLLFVLPWFHADFNECTELDIYEWYLLTVPILPFTIISRYLIYYGLVKEDASKMRWGGSLIFQSQLIVILRFFIKSFGYYGRSLNLTEIFQIATPAFYATFVFAFLVLLLSNSIIKVYQYTK